MVSAGACSAARTLPFTTFDLKYPFENFVVDTPVETPFPVGGLCVNCNQPTRLNQYRKAADHAIVLNIARAMSMSRLFMNGRHMLIFGSFRTAKSKRQGESLS